MATAGVEPSLFFLIFFYLKRFFSLLSLSLSLLCNCVVPHSTQSRTTDLLNIGHRSFGIPTEGGSDVKYEQNASSLLVGMWHIKTNESKVSNSHMRR